MASLNRVLLIGNLTRDPEIRYTTSGAAICGFGLAMNRRFTTASGEQREETCFVDIDVWGRQAESCHNYLKKGSMAFVEGRLRFDQWDDRETGRKRNRLTVTAERVQFLSRGGDSAPDGHESFQAAPSPSAPAPNAPVTDVPHTEAPPFPTASSSPSTVSDGGANDSAIDDIPF